MRDNMNVFKALYNGDFNAFERKVIRTAENKAIYKKLDSETRYFTQKMSLDDAERFKQLENLFMESNNYEQEDAFAYGFKFATMLMCAVFTGDVEASK